VARACAKDASERQQTAAALREELAAALGPAFTLPPGATPATSLPSLLPAEQAEHPTPILSPPRASAAFVRALEGAAPLGVARRGGARAREAWTRAGGLVRAKPLLAAALAAAALLAAATVASVAWQRGRAAAEARALLAADRASEARAVLDAALERRPADPELLLLMGRALHRLPGRAGEGIEAYAAARQHAPLDDAAREDLVRDLGRERSVADRAARLLREEGDLALPAVLPAAQGAKGVHRLRALTVARDLGAEPQMDLARAYGELLEDADCDVRRAAARRLGEIGDAAALQPLRKAALATTGTKGFFGTKTAPACGAAEADAAARRIEAARRP
jgi:serine/threonine-protein kinase